MNKLLTLCFLIVSTIGFSPSETINTIKIKPTVLPKEYKSSQDIECQAIQSKLLYKNPEMYRFIIGKTIEKQCQTFEHKGKKGSLLYFEFDRNANEGKGFVEGLLWGGEKPSKAHPETIITKGNIIIVLSFPFKSDLSKELTKIVSRR
ncbi:hypothetical protein ES692_14595 [Psychroserpens burtonensis]|uniref:Uncharacterized protein n=1 Tax=Psychroserpens burtonensis TaxID=49278 RepID=A0A5C7B814_9FLAO|nr:hypothetical protein [Psychroserpens burtonensis]TXE15982.1 hypothetical protein ES692_14595 [Psychroserpens burtonensis]